MSVAFETARITFPKTKGGPQMKTGHVTFKSAVKLADASIKGYSIGFDDADHELYRESIEITEIRVDSFDSTKVQVDVAMSLRDKSGEFDDNYSGEVAVLVTAVLAA